MRVEALRRIAAEEPLRVRVSGACMAPAFADGAAVALAPARLLWPGDVVAFAAGDRLVLHRVIGYRPRGRALALLTQADAAALPDAPVPLSSVVGRVAARPSSADRLRALARLARHVAARLRARLP